MFPATLNINVVTIATYYCPHFEGLLSSSIKFITKEKLYGAAIIFLAVTVLLIGVTYVYLYINKRTFFYKQRIRKQLDFWISKAILEEMDDENGSVKIPSRFRRVINNPIVRQFVVDELIATKKGLTGEAASNIVKIYLQLGLKESSLKKMEHKKWHIKARGIQELYVMEQTDMLTRIYRQTNSNNEFVRMEAQTGIIHLSGFKGLRFLNIVAYPITEWQQLKLLDQLSQVTFGPMNKMGKWLQSTNPSVVLFALRIVETHQQFQVHDEVAKCLDHELEAIRIQAVRTLASIADESTASIIATSFDKEKFTGKLNILEHLIAIATPNQFDFLLGLQEHPNDLIKLNAAIALANCSPLGIAALETRAVLQPEPYQKILLHVQSAIRA